jgi:hypothetical protein
MKQPQKNFRLAEEHHDLFGRLVARIRQDPALADTLEDVLSHPTVPVVTPLEQRRDAVLEEIRRVGDDYLRQFARMRAELNQHTGDTLAQQRERSAEELQVSSEQFRGGSPVQSQYYVLPPKGNKQITEKGEREIRRQLELGIHPITIANFIGVGPKCIRKRKKELAAEQAQNAEEVDD